MSGQWSNSVTAPPLSSRCRDALHQGSVTIETNTLSYDEVPPERPHDHGCGADVTSLPDDTEGLVLDASGANKESHHNNHSPGIDSVCDQPQVGVC